MKSRPEKWTIQIYRVCRKSGITVHFQRWLDWQNQMMYNLVSVLKSVSQWQLQGLMSQNTQMNKIGKQT